MPGLGPGQIIGELPAAARGGRIRMLSSSSQGLDFTCASAPDEDAEPRGWYVAYGSRHGAMPTGDHSLGVDPTIPPHTP